ncbi:unnamed protein product [Rotaria sordida]|uniref:SDR family oxidoreductase n=1 Tax=Rotaria sordida TaxID=392033 RepID=A0A813W0D7_9BILA|nr:unnamed protein product [Rotaria sordida]
MADNQKLKDRVAIVTGADSGIGQGVAITFAKAGADVVITYRSDEKGAKETAKRVIETGRKALVVQTDVGDESQNKRMGGTGKPVHESDFSEWEKVIRTNLHGPFMCSKLAAKQFIKQIESEGKQSTENRGKRSGNIINISSVHEESVAAGQGAYAVSKSGLRNLTRAMALELADYGIRVNDVSPGMILTPMNQESMDDSKTRKEKEKEIPLKRAGIPDDIANMVLYLCSDDASYCTGATFYVDGGWMLTRPDV